MQKKTTYALNIGFMILILAGTFYVLLKDQDLGKIYEVFKQVHQRYVVGAIIAGLLYVIFEGLSLHVILYSLQFKLRSLQCIKYSFIGFLFNAITPSASGGQPMQVIYMHQDGISVGASSVSLLFWTIIYKVVLLLVEGWVFLFYRDFAVSHLGGYMWLFLVGLGVNLVSILLYSIIVFSRTGAKRLTYMATWICAKLRLVRHREKLHEKVDKTLETYREGAQFMKTHWGTAAVVLALTMVQRISYFAVTWFIYKAFGLSGYTFIEILILQSFVAVCIDILPFPGGVGANEGFFVTLFKSVMGKGYVFSAMLLSRGASFYVLLIASAVVTLIAQIYHIHEKTKQEAA